MEGGGGGRGGGGGSVLNPEPFRQYSLLACEFSPRLLPF